MNFFTILTDWINEHPKQTVGAFFGFLTGLLILVFGFWKTLFVAFLAFIGFLIGKSEEPLTDKIKEIFDKKKY